VEAVKGRPRFKNRLFSATEGEVVLQVGEVSNGEVWLAGRKITNYSAFVISLLPLKIKATPTFELNNLFD
jgi:hypothetical protein